MGECPHDECNFAHSVIELDVRNLEEKFQEIEAERQSILSGGDDASSSHSSSADAWVAVPNKRRGGGVGGPPPSVSCPLPKVSGSGLGSGSSGLAGPSK